MAPERPKLNVRKLIQLRYEAGLSPSQLGERAGLSQHVVAYLERGEREPYPATLKALADALGVNVSDLTTVDQP